MPSIQYDFDSEIFLYGLSFAPASGSLSGQVPPVGESIFAYIDSGDVVVIECGSVPAVEHYFSTDQFSSFGLRGEQSVIPEIETADYVDFWIVTQGGTESTPGTAGQIGKYRFDKSTKQLSVLTIQDLPFNVGKVTRVGNRVISITNSLYQNLVTWIPAEARWVYLSGTSVAFSSAAQLPTAIADMWRYDAFHLAYMNGGDVVQWGHITLVAQGDAPLVRIIDRDPRIWPLDTSFTDYLNGETHIATRTVDNPSYDPYTVSFPVGRDDQVGLLSGGLMCLVNADGSTTPWVPFSPWAGPQQAIVQEFNRKLNWNRVFYDPISGNNIFAEVDPQQGSIDVASLWTLPFTTSADGSITVDHDNFRKLTDFDNQQKTRPTQAEDHITDFLVLGGSTYVCIEGLAYKIVWADRHRQTIVKSEINPPALPAENVNSDVKAVASDEIRPIRVSDVVSDAEPMRTWPFVVSSSNAKAILAKGFFNEMAGVLPNYSWPESINEPTGARIWDLWTETPFEEASFDSGGAPSINMIEREYPEAQIHLGLTGFDEDYAFKSWDTMASLGDSGTMGLQVRTPGFQEQTQRGNLMATMYERLPDPRFSDRRIGIAFASQSTTDYIYTYQDVTAPFAVVGRRLAMCPSTMVDSKKVFVFWDDPEGNRWACVAEAMRPVEYCDEFHVFPALLHESDALYDPRHGTPFQIQDPEATVWGGFFGEYRRDVYTYRAEHIDDGLAVFGYVTASGLKLAVARNDVEREVQVSSPTLIASGEIDHVSFARLGVDRFAVGYWDGSTCFVKTFLIDGSSLVEQGTVSLAGRFPYICGREGQIVLVHLVGSEWRIINFNEALNQTDQHSLCPHRTTVIDNSISVGSSVPSLERTVELRMAAYCFRDGRVFVVTGCDSLYQPFWTVNDLRGADEYDSYAWLEHSTLTGLGWAGIRITTDANVNNWLFTTEDSVLTLVDRAAYPTYRDGTAMPGIIPLSQDQILLTYAGVTDQELPWNENSYQEAYSYGEGVMCSGAGVGHWYPDEEVFPDGELMARIGTHLEHNWWAQWYEDIYLGAYGERMDGATDLPAYETNYYDGLMVGVVRLGDAEQGVVEAGKQKLVSLKVSGTSKVSTTPDGRFVVVLFSAPRHFATQTYTNRSSQFLGDNTICNYIAVYEVYPDLSLVETDRYELNEQTGTDGWHHGNICRMHDCMALYQVYYSPGSFNAATSDRLHQIIPFNVDESGQVVVGTAAQFETILAPFIGNFNNLGNTVQGNDLVWTGRDGTNEGAAIMGLYWPTSPIDWNEPSVLNASALTLFGFRVNDGLVAEVGPSTWPGDQFIGWKNTNHQGFAVLPESGTLVIVHTSGNSGTYDYVNNEYLWIGEDKVSYLTLNDDLTFTLKQVPLRFPASDLTTGEDLVNANVSYRAAAQSENVVIIAAETSRDLDFIHSNVSGFDLFSILVDPNGEEAVVLGITTNAMAPHLGWNYLWLYPYYDGVVAAGVPWSLWNGRLNAIGNEGFSGLSVIQTVRADFASDAEFVNNEIRVTSRRKA